MMRPLRSVLIGVERGEYAVRLEGGKDVWVERGGENGGVDKRGGPIVVGHVKGTSSALLHWALDIVCPVRRMGPQTHYFIIFIIYCLNITYDSRHAGLLNLQIQIHKSEIQPHLTYSSAGCALPATFTATIAAMSPTTYPPSSP